MTESNTLLWHTLLPCYSCSILCNHSNLYAGSLTSNLSVSTSMPSSPITVTRPSSLSGSVCKPASFTLSAHLSAPWSQNHQYNAPPMPCPSVSLLIAWRQLLQWTSMELTLVKRQPRIYEYLLLPSYSHQVPVLWVHQTSLYACLISIFPNNMPRPLLMISTTT